MKKAKLAKVDVNKDSLREELSYPSSWQKQLFQTKWRVLAPYQISRNDIHANNWADLLIDEHTGSTDFELIKRSVSHEYNPFEVEFLFEKFAKINTRDHNEILSFVDKYGLLGLDVEFKMGAEMEIRRTLMLNNPYSSDVTIDEPLHQFIEEVLAMRDTLQAIKDIEEENLDNIKQRRLKVWAEGHKSFSEVDLDTTEFDSAEHSIEKIIRKLDPEKAKRMQLDIAKNNLSNRINKHIGYVTPHLHIGEDGSYLAGYTSLSLLSIMYYQVFLYITNTKNKRKMEECQKCGDLFVQRKVGVKFCPSEDPDKRSSCENSYNQMKKRAREAILSDQKTVEEVSESLNRPIEEVRSWIEDYIGKYKG